MILLVNLGRYSPIQHFHCELGLNQNPFCLLLLWSLGLLITSSNTVHGLANRKFWQRLPWDIGRVRSKDAPGCWHGDSLTKCRRHCGLQPWLLSPLLSFHLSVWILGMQLWSVQQSVLVGPECVCPDSGLPCLGSVASLIQSIHISGMVFILRPLRLWSTLLNFVLRLNLNWLW